MTRAVAFAVLLAAGIATTAARGDNVARPSVVLLRPEPADPAFGQIFVRIEGELRAAGFDVTSVAKAPDDDPRAAIDKAFKSLSPAAVIGVFGDPLVGSVELWVADRLSGRSLIRRVDAESESGSRASEILAIRAAEQLSASLIELDLGPKAATPTQAPAPTPKPIPTDRPIRPSRFQAELGIGSLFAFDGATPTVTPVARVSWAALPAWWLRVTGAWLGTASSISSQNGSASFSQDVLLVEGVFSPSRPGKLGLRASLGAGTLHVGVAGHGSGAIGGLDSSSWSAAVDAGVGLCLRRVAGMGFALEGHAIFANPYPVVRLLDEAQATTGRPTVFVSAALTGDL